jgi:lysozyme
VIVGIDTSSVAGVRKPDWRAARAGGAAFAILRATYGSWVDPFFLAQWDNLKAAGLVRGAYLFLRHDAKAGSVGNQVQAFVKNVSLEPGDLPPVLDVEFSGGLKSLGLDVVEALDRILGAMDQLHDAYGCEPIVYTSARVVREDLNDDAEFTSRLHAGAPMWLARYPFKPGPPVLDPKRLADYDLPVPAGCKPDEWWLHQYQGDAVGFPGIATGKVDVNRFNAFLGEGGPRAAWVRGKLGVSNAWSVAKFDKLEVGYIRSYQEQHGLVADGIVGPRTFAFLAREAG